MTRIAAAVLKSLSDPGRWPTREMQVLRILRKAEGEGRWLSIPEIAEAVSITTPNAASRIRDLRVMGFTIKKAKRPTGARIAVWEYKLFTDPA